MKAKKYTLNGEEKGFCELPAEIFEVEVNNDLIHSVVKGYLANQRQGTAKAKGRSEVSGGGKKPYKQKGTGRARAGSNTSPIWVRGGKAFGPNPREYGGTIPKKMRRAALCSALSDRANNGSIVVVEGMEIEKPQTKVVGELFSKLDISNKRNLLLIGEDDQNIYLSGRNLKNVNIKHVNDINVYDIMQSENVIFSAENLVEKVKEVVKK